MGLRNAGVILALLTLNCLPLLGDSPELKSAPPGVVKALHADEKLYCDQFLGSFKKGCHQTFRANLLWRQLVITPSGQAAILVESKSMGDCGSAGCSLFLFLQRTDGHFVQVLGTQGDVGAVERVEVLKDVTRDHYDIQKTWADGKRHTIYKWDGLRYSDPTLHR